MKRWTGYAMVAALAGAGLAGCSDGGENAIQATAMDGDEGHDVGALPVELRLVFMAGHVEAGLALYRAGDSEAAAPHLLHPVSETHADERSGLDALGFDPAPFEAVSAALEAGEQASTVEPQLAAAEANLSAMRAAAGGDAKAQIRFLMETAVEEYTIAVTDGAVTDPAEYQDAWGFVKVARAIADDLDTPNADTIRSTLDKMLGLWPDTAPVPPERPAPADQVSALASRATMDLPQ